MFKAITFLLFALMSMGSLAQGIDKPSIDFKSLQKSNWTKQELENALLIKDFVQSLMNNHDFDYVLAQYNNSAYKQHNRNLPDKMTGLVGFLKDFVEDYPEYSYDVKRILVDGDFVIFHSHATLYKDDRGNDQKGMNIIDTWRVEDGRIVEHWDSIQALDGFMRFYSLISGGTIRNDNGVF
ncbi:nuclear transport factor 2 family protein [Pseudoalteromonas sp. MMG022]|uniref:nuclear transport factor 2 family protein n=1 Tax=Pseudoalteromonas sp. MMG022 TaxID=2909978 RepID=UPI001F163F76|nr:nuclear transport factor 2 family protein [Pseudoalteromonas sp. MMG022]MCF6437484.1 nuclear transport factor 2 family protein [Pseudoalteromonas sp. MMG022]